MVQIFCPCFVKLMGFAKTSVLAGQRSVGMRMNAQSGAAWIVEKSVTHTIGEIKNVERGAVGIGTRSKAQHALILTFVSKSAVGSQTFSHISAKLVASVKTFAFLGRPFALTLMNVTSGVIWTSERNVSNTSHQYPSLNLHKPTRRPRQNHSSRTPLLCLRFWSSLLGLQMGQMSAGLRW